MSLPVIFRPEADADVDATRTWYEDRCGGLGDRFVSALSAVLERIAALPELHAPVWQDVRFARLRRFPYVVYYRVLSDRVEVFAVLHGSRDQSAWHDRL